MESQLVEIDEYERTSLERRHAAERVDADAHARDKNAEACSLSGARYTYTVSLSLSLCNSGQCSMCCGGHRSDGGEARPSERGAAARREWRECVTCNPVLEAVSVTLTL